MFAKLFPVRNLSILSLRPISQYGLKFLRPLTFYGFKGCNKGEIAVFKNAYQITFRQSSAKNIFGRNFLSVPLVMKMKTVTGETNSKSNVKEKSGDSKKEIKNKESKIINLCKRIMKRSSKSKSKSQNNYRSKSGNNKKTPKEDFQKKGSGKNEGEKQKESPCKGKEEVSKIPEKHIKENAKMGKCDNSKTEDKKPKETKESSPAGDCAKKSSKQDKDEKKKVVNENPCKGKENLMAMLYKQHDIRVEETKKPTPCQGEVLIAMNCVALCPQDLNYYTKEGLVSPIVLGRDGTGVVAGLGQGVRSFREGDRVVIEPHVPCGQCEYCKNCQYHLCCHMKTCGQIPHNGLLTCYFKHSADYCHKLPDSITMEEGALMHMLANSINVCSRCPMCVGQSLLVIGAGPVGWASLIVAKAMGATNTCVMCKFENRLELSKLYDTNTIRICDNASPEDMAQTVREKLGCAPAITIDTVGSEVSMKMATASTSSGGTIVLAGVSNGEHKIPLADIARRDITIRSALRQSKKFPAAIALAKSGINLKPLISHHFFLEETAKAFKTLIENQATVNKVIIHMKPRNEK